jgi:hypothetical protein
MLKFVHEFEEDPPYSDLSVDTDASPAQFIQVSVRPDQKVWISANREGWLHLARICSELGTRELEEGYHFHKGFNFVATDASEPEIQFEIAKE